jgi:LysR family transcriptional regulator, glycine cleavage system transcriptional activator
LFIRKTRAVVLTDEGRSLSLVLTKAFDDIRTQIEVHGQTTHKTVTLAVGPIFGTRWLVPRLAQFRRDLPNIDLIVCDSPRITDAVMMSTHLAVDWGDGNWSALDSHKLLEITYAPVLSAALLADGGGLATPKDLMGYPIIHQRDHSEWTAWFNEAGCINMTLKDETIITDSNTVMQAAIEGQGVALGIFPFVACELQAGRLIKPFEIDLKPSRSFYLLAKPRSERTPAVASVIRWLLDQVAS